MKFCITITCLFYLINIVVQCNGDQVRDSMFNNIKGSLACYRRLNATHQTGCSSKRGGSTGVIHFCKQLKDLDFILENGNAGPYIPIMPTELFKRNTLNKLLKSSSQISGAVIYLNSITSNYSHDVKCPNDRFNVENTCTGNGWNPYGSGLMHIDIPFPIFYVENQTTILQLKNCFNKFNNYSYSNQIYRSLCSVELDSFMYATVNTPTCLRRSNIESNLNPIRVCDALGDYNIWASLFPLVKEIKNKTKPIKDFEYILIAARMDTTSFFDKTSGAENPVTSIISLITIAKLLKEMIPIWNENIKKNALFVLFTGETYDYIGSQRFLYDLKNGKFPAALSENNDFLPIIYPENITLFIELSQLAKTNVTYVHYLQQNAFITKLINNSNNKIKKVPNSLPPASIHTFLRNNRQLDGLVLADHEHEFRNHYYNSLFDNASNIHYQYYNGSDIPNDSVQQFIGQLSTVVAESIYEEIIGKKYDGNVSVDLVMIDELFHCFLEDPNCKINSAIQKGKFSKTPLSLYISVDLVNNFLTDYILHILAWVTGDILGPSNPNCTNLDKSHVYTYFNMSKNFSDFNTRFCYRATVNRTEAVSPAFIIPDYDWSSNEYSSWAESSWLSLSFRIFLKPSAGHEHTTFAIGSVTIFLSFVFVYFINSRSDVLFAPSVANDAPVNC